MSKYVVGVSVLDFFHFCCKQVSKSRVYKLTVFYPYINFYLDVRMKVKTKNINISTDTSIRFELKSL